MTVQQMPEGSQNILFSDIAEQVAERVTPRAGDEKKFIGLQHLTSGSLRVDEWGGDIKLSAQAFKVSKGDIIFARRNTYLKRVAISPIDGICSADAIVMRPKGELIIPEFLPFFMQSDIFMDRVISISAGSLSSRVKWKDLADQKFSIPSKLEQEKLINLCSRVQRSDLANGSLNQSHRSLYLSVLTDIFQKGLKDPCWCKCYLDDCAELQTGLALSSKRVYKDETIDVPYLRVANVYDGQFDLDTIKTVKVTPTMFERFKVEFGDILIAEGGDYDKVGRGHIWTGKIPGVIHQNHLFVIRTDRTKLLPEFFNYLKSSFVGVKFFLGIAQQTTNLATINSSQVRKFPCVFPPIEVQKEIVAQLDMLKSYEHSLSEKKKSIESLYKAILNR